MVFTRLLRRLPVRYLSLAGFAGAITVGLFYVMFVLIEMDAVADLADAGTVEVFDYIRRADQPETPIENQDLPSKDVAEAPSAPEMDPVGFSGSHGTGLGLAGIGLAPSLPEVDLGKVLRVGSASADMIPMVRVRPIYPQSAANERIEGWVELRFTVSPTGSVVDPEVLRFHPSDVFNASALQAIRKWKYRPRVEDGQKVAVEGVQVRIMFRLEDYGR